MKEKGRVLMTFLISVLFLVAIVLYDKRKTQQAKKRADSESRKRIAQFNNYMKKLKNIQGDK